MTSGQLTGLYLTPFLLLGFQSINESADVGLGLSLRVIARIHDVAFHKQRGYLDIVLNQVLVVYLADGSGTAGDAAVHHHAIYMVFLYPVQQFLHCRITGA